MNKKTKITIPTTLISTLVTATAVATYKTIKHAFYRPEKVRGMFRENESESTKNYVLSQQFEKLQITTKDGLTLKGYLLKNNTNKLIICVHGYHSNAFRSYSEFLKFYYESGYSVFIPNNRAHGNSDGKIIGFGWLDRLDLLQWIDLLIHHLGDDIQIALQGISMGGATVLMASGEALPKNVKCIVADCSFTSVYNQLKHVLHDANPVLEYIILPVINLVSKPTIGYNLKNASALKQVEKSTTPTLFIHGGEDDYVPTNMVYQLYEHCHADKDLLIVNNAEHAKSYSTNQALYEDKVSEFLNKYMS